ncbi:sensor histidine kinase [Cystobacter fuscus DSM 2262]|uniref:histidine kinase n=1 Tax=Cystobacter fuscus (strain ATCC 25194 / DSM 2262 / NBRC 100088 / M29) TaxID=1242864 RepID=S9QR34_CYSF2|nr:ATP-binding protein [Cystobacter fuscus]EPX63764.1 sensor histidine kinase [Cystobacter fuscus DSM 2262]
MNKPFDETPEGPMSWESLRDSIVGLGERSIRKSYYGALQERITELARFRSLLDAIHEAIIVTELPGLRVLDANRKGLWMLGASNTAQLCQPLESFFAPNEWRILEACVHPSEREPRPGPGLLSLQREGEERVLELSIRQDTFGQRQYLVLIARDVTERVRIEQALLAAKEEAEAAARAKAQFLGIASHELRTPLTSLLLLLQQGARRTGEACGGELLNRMLRLARRLAVLVEDLLEVSRLEHDQIVMRPTHIDLRTIVADVVADFRARAPTRPLSLRLPPAPAYVEADTLRVVQVLSNLLENAIKYSLEGAPVEVRLELVEATARVWVSDQGPGIPEERRAQLFTPFGRLREAGQDSPGLGLGLYISRQLAELQGGKLELAPSRGEGTTFTFTLPLLSWPAQGDMEQELASQPAG